MSDDTEAAALRARLEAIIKEAEDAEAQAAAARRRVQAARLLMEESKTTALEQTATAARQRVPSSPSSASSSPPPPRPHRLFDQTNAPWPTYGHPCQGHMTMYPGPGPAGQ
jgi:septal ring factor EnvC (AmiA/AmiB activator)